MLILGELKWNQWLNKKSTGPSMNIPLVGEPCKISSPLIERLNKNPALDVDVAEISSRSIHDGSACPWKNNRSNNIKK